MLCIGVVHSFFGFAEPNIVATSTPVGGYYRLRNGVSQEVTITVVYQPRGENVAVRLQLLELRYDDASVEPGLIWKAEPLANYRSDIVTIVN